MLVNPDHGIKSTGLNMERHHIHSYCVTNKPLNDATLHSQCNCRNWSKQNEDGQAITRDRFLDTLLGDREALERKNVNACLYKYDIHFSDAYPKPPLENDL